MMFLTLLSALLPLALSQTHAPPDPTTICWPDIIQFESYDLNTEEFFVNAADFTKGIYSRKGDYSFVQDQNNLKTYVIRPDGACVSFDVTKEDLVFQCFPASSTYVSDIYIGFGPNAVPAQLWEVLTSNDRIRYAVTNQPGQPRYPILSVSTSDSVFYYNPTLNITVPGILDIPTVPCPLSTIV